VQDVAETWRPTLEERHSLDRSCPGNESLTSSLPCHPQPNKGDKATEQVLEEGHARRWSSSKPYTHLSEPAHGLLCSVRYQVTAANDFSHTVLGSLGNLWHIRDIICHSRCKTCPFWTCHNKSPNRHEEHWMHAHSPPSRGHLPWAWHSPSSGHPLCGGTQPSSTGACMPMPAANTQQIQPTSSEHSITDRTPGQSHVTFWAFFADSKMASTSSLVQAAQNRNVKTSCHQLPFWRAGMPAAACSQLSVPVHQQYAKEGLVHQEVETRQELNYKPCLTFTRKLSISTDLLCNEGSPILLVPRAANFRQVRRLTLPQSPNTETVLSNCCF
jgi:hypothetical protein